jgi:hypothetical protein
MDRNLQSAVRSVSRLHSSIVLSAVFHPNHFVLKSQRAAAIVIAMVVAGCPSWLSDGWAWR